MPKNNFRTPDGDIENESYITEPWLIENFIGDQLWGWGKNDSGQLGINIRGSNISTPVTTFSGNTQWQSVSKGQLITAAIKTNGSLWVWGATDYLGVGPTGSTLYFSTPVTTFAGGNDWKQVSCGRNHMAAIKYDGSLWVWGGQSFGELGVNSEQAAKNTPVTTFAGGNNWKQVSCGHYFTSAIKTDGSLWVWGNNSNATLGTGSTVGNCVTPVTTYAGGNDWKQVSVNHSCVGAIKTDGSLWMWGKNDFGNLGTNDTGTKSTPVTTYAGGNDWKQVTTSYNSMAAIKTDGSLWTCGYNSNGNLGTNDVVTRLTPVTTFAGGNNWKQVEMGNNDDTIAAIKTDGSLWLWGYGNYGSHGLGPDTTATFRLTPVTTYKGGNNWKQVVNSNQTTFAVTSGPDY